MANICEEDTPDHLEDSAILLEQKNLQQPYFLPFTLFLTSLAASSSWQECLRCCQVKKKEAHSNLQNVKERLIRVKVHLWPSQTGTTICPHMPKPLV